MNGKSAPVIKDLVLIGGGHAHVSVLKRFGMRPIAGVQLTLISPDALTPYSGMLPGLIAGHYTHAEAHIDLLPLCKFSGARFFSGAVTHVNPEAQLVHMAGRPPVPYDVLSINSGSTPDPSVIPGAQGRVLPVKPVSEFLLAWEALKQRVLANPRSRIGAIGAGAGGIELLLSAQFALRSMLRAHNITDEPEFHIVTRGSTILPAHNARVQALFFKVLERENIALHCNFDVDRVNERGGQTGGNVIALDEILFVTGANAPQWIRKSGLAVDAGGFIKVQPSLQSVSHPNVFAAGDIAAVEAYPRPKSGVFAVRQGAPLEANIRRALFDKKPHPFKPQLKFLSLISAGGKHAVASYGGWCMSGGWVWRWKDRIDRGFMNTFNKLPAMDAAASSPSSALPAAFKTDVIEKQIGPLQMRCGGCGAKVSAATLDRVLAQISPYPHEGVATGLHPADDAAVIVPPPGKHLVQSADFFPAMIDDPHVFAQIAANHALGDIYAMGAKPQSALAIVVLPPGLPEKTEALLVHMMAGASGVLAAAGCALIGGHTSEGAELALGFAVTGIVEPQTELRKSGMHAGDVLILTKPVGTGTLFAAAMRAKAKGPWLQGAVENALLSNDQAVEILKSHGATACTDVTGFGLAGHLHEMVVASGCDAALDIAAVPVLAGALETIGDGIVSSIQHSNLNFECAIENRSGFEKDLRYQVMFDPQTAGGLLASVSRDNAGPAIRALHAAGYETAAVIGDVLAPMTEVRRISLQ